jgi:hypothetical protein
MYTVKSYHSSHRIMYCITSDIRLWDITIHMEVDTIPTDYTRLSTIQKLTVGNMCYQTILSTTCKHQMSTVVSFLWWWIPFNFDISSE